MIADAPAATRGLASPSGWMTVELFLKVMQHFTKYAHASKENPALLIFDNHASHISIPVIELAKESGVHLLTIHPHCFHKPQPLDVAVYGPFKVYYDTGMNAELLHRPRELLGIYDVGKLVKLAHTKAMSPTNIISRFRRTGIFPFNDDIFGEHVFFNSCVSDRPESQGPTQEITDSVKARQENEAGSTSSATPLLHVSSDLIASDSSQSTPNSDRTASPPHSSSAEFVSPLSVYGLPKAKPRKSTRKRTVFSSMVLTDTPWKNFLESTAQKGKASKKQTKGVKLMGQSKANQARISSAKQKKKKRARRSLNLIESDSSDDELPHLCDHSSDAVLDDGEFEDAVCVPDFLFCSRNQKEIMSWLNLR